MAPQSLGSQNDKLKSNYEAIRTELIQLREKHNMTRKQLLEAVESRVAADQRTETLVHKWKVQLEARTRELETLQAKLVPQDLDMLRAKVQEELEVPQQRRVALLEAEVERHRQMFCKARREHERCKVRDRVRLIRFARAACRAVARAVCNDRVDFCRKYWARCGLDQPHFFNTGGALS